MQKPIKSLGQNFLKDEIVADNMIRSLDINQNDVVVEIGGGLGALTQKLINQNFFHLYVYEIDKNLIGGLRSILKNKDNVSVICESILDVDFDKLKANGKELKIIGSIPYYITSPIIHKLLESKVRAERIVLLIQKEVSKKILSRIPKANYWTHIILGYDASLIDNVKADDFYPAPKVNSASILLTKNKNDEEILLSVGFFQWSKFLHHAFRVQRKMLNKAFSSEMLKKLKIDSNLRPQNLSRENLLSMLRFTLQK